MLRRLCGRKPLSRKLQAEGFNLLLFECFDEEELCVVQKNGSLWHSVKDQQQSGEMGQH